MSVAEAGTVYRASLELRASEEIRYRKNLCHPQRVASVITCGRSSSLMHVYFFPKPDSSKSQKGSSGSA